MLARVSAVCLFLNATAAFACEQVGMRCVIPAQTRTINGVQVYRDCWEYQYSLKCDDESKNDCSKINAENCDLVEEKCLKMEKGVCVNYERSFACEKDVKYEEEVFEILKDGKPDDGKGLICSGMCLDGSCVEKAHIEKNEELGASVGLLNALKNVNQDVRVNIFSGVSEHCDKKLLSYTNCCKMSGWGKMLGAGCGPEAENLAKKRREKKCVELGTYCSSKLLFGICGIKRTVFCCYDSALVKILNQEAKKQLGRGNGNAETPQCGGLALDDLEAVDFTKADFSDYLNKELLPQLKVPHVEEAEFRNDSEEIMRAAERVPDECKGFRGKEDDKM